MLYKQRVIIVADVKSANVFAAQAWANIFNSSTLSPKEYPAKTDKQIQLYVVTHYSPIVVNYICLKQNRWPGDIMSQVINSHFIEYVGYMSPHLLQTWILIKCIRL